MNVYKLAGKSSVVCNRVIETDELAGPIMTQAERQAEDVDVRTVLSLSERTVYCRVKTGNSWR